MLLTELGKSVLEDVRSDKRAFGKELKTLLDGFRSETEMIDFVKWCRKEYGIPYGDVITDAYISVSTDRYDVKRL